MDADLSREIMRDGYKAGLWKAISMLREGAAAYDVTDSRKLHHHLADQMAAEILRSWANGIEIEASKELPE